MGARTRVDHYRGRKDSALALHYLWRIGDAMIARRDRFERVYALTEAVAPPELVREHDSAEADDFLLLKTVAADGPGADAHGRQRHAAKGRPQPSSRRGASGSWPRAS